MHFKRLLVAGALCAMFAAAAATAFGGSRSDLAAAKAGTAPFHRIAVTQAAGYGLIRDAKGIACIDMPGMGAMGVHYGKGALLGDTALDPAAPEILVYEPAAHGSLKLVALEYLVFQKEWDATHSSPPRLFGQTFLLTPDGNRYGIPAFYALHAWIWKHNPAGMFASWNPRVSCTVGKGKD